MMAVTACLWHICILHVFPPLSCCEKCIYIQSSGLVRTQLWSVYRANSAFTRAGFALVVMDMYNHFTKNDQKYFRESRDKVFGATLEDVSLTCVVLVTNTCHASSAALAAATGHADHMHGALL